MKGHLLGIVQSSRVWTALGWTEEEASFWPANLGARAIVVVVAVLVEVGGLERFDEAVMLLFRSDGWLSC